VDDRSNSEWREAARSFGFRAGSGCCRTKQISEIKPDSIKPNREQHYLGGTTPRPASSRAGSGYGTVATPQSDHDHQGNTSHFHHCCLIPSALLMRYIIAFAAKNKPIRPSWGSETLRFVSAPAEVENSDYQAQGQQRRTTKRTVSESRTRPISSDPPGFGKGLLDLFGVIGRRRQGSAAVITFDQEDYQCQTKHQLYTLPDDRGQTMCGRYGGSHLVSQRKG